MLNLLTEPLIQYHTPGVNRVKTSLPEVYAALMADEVMAFPALRPHQRHAWHAFLVQLGAMAMHQEGLNTPPETAEEWAGLIRGLTSDFQEDEPWQLAVEDITKPAFMQPPASSKEREKDYKTSVATPDELDMLVTSKNHDLKTAVALQAGLDDWIFALTTLQTMEGYGGRYNYGVSRMPSGYGNRSAFSFAPSISPGSHVKHDLVTLLKNRHLILDEYPMTDNGIGLLWLVPWDGTKAEPKLITELDPFFIEICRRVRLRRESGTLVAIRANSDDRRVVDAKGLVGDPWMPVSNKTNPKGTPPAFLGPRKFGYERIVDGLISPDWNPATLLKEPPSGGDTQLVARGMVRGEGGTEGYHERIIPLRQKTVQLFGRSGGPKELGDLAKERIEQIAKVKGILRLAIATFAAGGRAERPSDEHRSLARPWADKLDEIVDADFFDALQRELDVEPDERQVIRNKWLMNGNDGVLDHAHDILHMATESIPVPSIQRFRARARADSAFEGSLHGSNGLPFLF